MIQLFELLTPKEAKSICALALPWKEGRARTQSLTGTIKRNEEADRYDETVKTLSAQIEDRFFGQEDIQKAYLCKAVSGFRVIRYANGGEYQRHTDAPLMGDVRSDLACTLFLSEDYEGGELCIESPQGVQVMRGRTGQCVIYPCSAPHWVMPVTKGERICAITWIESYIQDQHKRTLLNELHRVCMALEPKDRALFVDCGKIHGDLMRMWM